MANIKLETNIGQASLSHAAALSAIKTFIENSGGTEHTLVAPVLEMQLDHGVPTGFFNANCYYTEN